MIRMGIIGCGAIGTALSKAIQKQFKSKVRIAYFSDISEEQVRKFQKSNPKLQAQFVRTSELILKSDFIIETASQYVVKTVVPEVLKQGKDILVLSVGGLLQIKCLEKLAQKS